MLLTQPPVKHISLEAGLTDPDAPVVRLEQDRQLDRPPGRVFVEGGIRLRDVIDELRWMQSRGTRPIEWMTIFMHGFIEATEDDRRVVAART